jgi:phosphoglycolate phosphatase-like HAD superfamily hydrolase
MGLLVLPGLTLMARATVFLFDIDGTLITTGGAGRRAMERAFGAVHGRPDAMGFPMDGMTDRLIVRQALAHISAETTEAEIDRVLAAYVDVLREEVAACSADRYRVHPGMREAIDGARMRGAAVGLGTGNIREGARVKLQRVGLGEAFGFGGFGCDAEDRVQLIRIGAERGAAALGATLDDCRVVIIGDTPKDVAAAQAIGAECVGVGTGHYTPAALMACGATAAFRDLAHPGALAALFGEAAAAAPA